MTHSRASICTHCSFSAARRYPDMYNVLPNITYRGVFRYRRGEETPPAQETNAAGEIQTVDAPRPHAGRGGSRRTVRHKKWMRVGSPLNTGTASKTRPITPKP